MKKEKTKKVIKIGPVVDGRTSAGYKTAIQMIQELHEEKNDGEAYKSAVIQILDAFGLRIQSPEFRAKVEKIKAKMRKEWGF